MKENRQQKKKKIRIKILLILEAVICYMAFLNVISHIQGPPQYQALTDAPLLMASDFINLDGKKIIDDSLHLTNQNRGNAVGYQAQVELHAVDAIQINFIVNCPVEYVGTTLYVDLYNEQLHYDNPEQEYQIELQSGLNEVSFSLYAGENAPDKVFLRIFTLDEANYKIERLHIYREEIIPKVIHLPLGFMVVSFIILCISVITYYFLYVKKK